MGYKQLLNQTENFFKLDFGNLTIFEENENRDNQYEFKASKKRKEKKITNKKREKRTRSDE